MANDKFLVVKEKDNKSIMYFEYDKIDGYRFIPKKTPFKDCINVNTMIIVNPSLIEKFLEKKANRRFLKIVDFVSRLYEEDDDSDGYNLVLNEITKFRLELYIKYKNLSKEKLDLLDKKLFILENQLSLRMKTFNINNIKHRETRSR